MLRTTPAAWFAFALAGLIPAASARGQTRIGPELRRSPRSGEARWLPSIGATLGSDWVAALSGDLELRSGARQQGRFELHPPELIRGVAPLVALEYTRAKGSGYDDDYLVLVGAAARW
ncbi:MAG: hypothetical protein HY716_13140 [Planctomycetes bacterium]|nr:hypothetical protein [Planctomycetota bacterium]